MHCIQAGTYVLVPLCRGGDADATDARVPGTLHAPTTMGVIIMIRMIMLIIVVVIIIHIVSIIIGMITITCIIIIEVLLLLCVLSSLSVNYYY